MARHRPMGDRLNRLNGRTSKQPARAAKDRRAAETVATSAPARLRHLQRMDDLSQEEVRALVGLAVDLQRRRLAGDEPRPAIGRVLGLVFEKPSMRTRVSFECAMAHLGGSCVFLTAKEIGLGERETDADFARVISGYVDALAIRTFSQSRVEELARHATVPVINALSDLEHPCQALGDLAVIQRRLGSLAGVKLAFVGDANNVARSLAVAAAKVGVQFVLAGPEAYHFPSDFVDQLASLGGRFQQTTDPRAAVSKADVVYTDVWTSMGQESETAERRSHFLDYQVNEKLFALAKKSAIFLHCLPAKRGEEVTAAVLDGPSSAVIEQAEFRLHAQKALLAWLLAETQGGDDVLATFR